MSNKIKVSEKKAVVFGKATDDQIAAWKKMYDEVHEIEVNGHYCYLHAFDRSTLKYALSQLSMKVNSETKEVDIDISKIIDIGEVALTNCWLAGSEEIKQNDKMFISAAMSAGQLMEFYEGNLKKL